MKPEVISGLFSIGAALIAFAASLIAVSINSKKNERTAQIKKLKKEVERLADAVISYSKLNDAIIGELKEWTDEYKKNIRADFYYKVFGDNNKSLMSEREAQRYLDELKDLKEIL
ncbi:MAG: hypothetical protein J5632_01140 [Bacteroidales bacterium]|nr:hypothetical protein [Bacteroidales bacterium]